ncbi:MAG: heavy metal-binding domain-containing protein [Planctomycetota bacterium]
MQEILSTIFPLLVVVVMLAIGFFVGGANERRHFRSLVSRETAMSNFVTTQSKHYLSPTAGNPPCLLVSEVVIASDYLKTFLAGLRNIFGGEVRSFETLIERGRREAVLRVQEHARELGYNAICNVRLNTAEVGGRRVAMAAVICTATAYHSSLSQLPAAAVPVADSA